MRYYKSSSRNGSHLLVENGNGAFDLTAVDERLDSFRTLARCADISGTTIDDLTRRYQQEAPAVDIAESDLCVPAKPPEVWAAGVTYEISEEAREKESDSPDLYLDVYHNDRPELFLKSTPSRTVGPRESVGVRGDSDWNVPEPELGVVLYNGEIVGYTVGNDVSSREIEGENPLYLPQAKTYSRSCAIGPCIASTESVPDPHDLDVQMLIKRDGDTVYKENTSTSNMIHDCDELVAYLKRHNTLPELTVLLTGTSLVPEDYTLSPNDEVTIEIGSIGTLENSVTIV